MLNFINTQILYIVSMRFNHILKVQNELTRTLKSEKKSHLNLKELNKKQLQEEEYDKMVESIPSRNKIIKRKIVLRNTKKSKNFLEWLFSNKEK